MSKELTPLQALKDLREDAKHHLDHHIVYLNKRLDIIESALKEYKVLKQDYNMIKEEYFLLDRDYEKDIKPKLKALEIIKKKKVDLGWFNQCSTVERYNDGIYKTWNKELTQKEYDLLKGELL